jgi:carboxyl-terminal processing protease
MRAVIQVDNVVAQQLSNGIGYIKLKQFSGNTVEEMHKAIVDFQSHGLRGLVLDLRNDPGGLLDQAIKVADEFLDAGTIVTTVGYAGKQREEKRASPGSQPKIPIAVLVNYGSASASEIVAGALKNLDRAVIIGSRTFGKGSVQVLYDNDDGSALKLTIAQYLTPGDVSIQSVGIMPDIALEATALQKDRITLFRPHHNLREQDLDAHLTSRNTRTGDKPIETIHYLWAQAKKKTEKALIRDEDRDPDEAGEGEEQTDEDALEDPDKFVEDFEIGFARDLLAQAKGWKRHEVLASSKPYFDRKIGEEQAKTADELKKLGIDWTPPPSSAPGMASSLQAQLTTDKPGNAVNAGDVIVLKATVTNHGSQPAEHGRAITKGDDLFMADREFVFGKIAPGESKSWTVPVRVEKGQLTRLDVVKLEVSDDKSSKLEPEDVKIKIDGLKRPRFAYAYQVIDDVRGNGDGLVQPGEEVRLHVTVKNVGEGKSYATQATLANKSGEGVDVNKGRFQVDNIAPGESRTVDFTFEVAPDYKQDNFALQMDVYDQALHEYVTDKLTFPIATQAVAVEKASGDVVALRDAELRAGADGAAPAIGHAARGAGFKVTGKAPGWYRVEVESGRPGFLAANDAQASAPPAGTAHAATTGFDPVVQVAPPRLVIEGAPLAVSTPVMRLRVSATDEKQVADSFVFVSNRTAKIDHRKVFYRSNRNGTAPKHLQFDAEIPLWPGANQVTVVARQSNQVQSQQTLIVDREGGTVSSDAAALNSRNPMRDVQ